MPVQTSYPGVYIEERPSGVHAIVGVSTSVTAFVGATRRGPANRPIRISSVAEFGRTFGGPWDAAHPLGHGVGHFFANGGSQAVVVRTLAAGSAPAAATLKNAAAASVLVLTAAGEGGWASRAGAVGMDAAVDYGASNSEDLFNLRLSLRDVDSASGSAVLVAQETYTDLSMSPAHPRYALDILRASGLVTAALPTPAPTTTDQGTSTSRDPVDKGAAIGATSSVLLLSVDYGSPVAVTIAAASYTTGAALAKAVQDALTAAGLTVTAEIEATTKKLLLRSPTKGTGSAVSAFPAPTSDASKVLGLGLTWGGSEKSGASALRPAATAMPTGLTGGVDGGTDAAKTDGKVVAADVVPGNGTTGMYALSGLDFPRFNLLCLPDLPATNEPAVAGTEANTQALGNALAFCQAQRAFLLVDTPPAWNTDPPAVGGLPALGQHGAIFYPRLQQLEQGRGGTTRRLDLPTSGAVAGVFARTDATRGVWKAPAGLEAGLVGAGGLSVATDDVISGRLNPKGVNVLRTFPGAGIVIWGARTLKGADSQSSEFKYVPVRRLTDYIASSLFVGTQFAVFEPNDPDLWAQLRLAVGTFMRGLFRQGAFQQSAKRAEADSFFVVCDGTVNPQSEIDLGRVHVVVGFAPLKPAEFVIVTITQISNLEA